MPAQNLEQTFLQEAMLGFSTLLMPISSFSWGVSEQAATLGDTIKVVHVQNNSGSGAFTYASGYTGDGTLVSTKNVTLNQLLYQRTTIDDASMSKLSAVGLNAIARAMGEGLARDVLSASFSACLSDANFPTSASVTQEALSSSIGFSTLVNQADTLNWTPQRSMILSPSAWNYVLKNTDISQAFSYGSSAPIQQGTVPQVMGFTMNKYTGVFPPLPQPIKGIVCDPSAIVIGMGIHKPADSKGLVQTEEITDTVTGLRLQMKRWYDPDYAVSKIIIECLFGSTLGNSSGLVKLK